MRPDIARQTGLSPTVQVMVGWNDLNTAMLGADLKLGEGFDLKGTSDHVGRALSAPPEEADPALAFVLISDTLALYDGVTAVSGGSLLWVRRWLGRARETRRQTVWQQAAGLPPGADGLLVLPYLSGARATQWRGAFLGLTERHQPAHDLRAVIEGVAYQLRSIYGRVLRGSDAMRYGIKLRPTSLASQSGWPSTPKGAVLGQRAWPFGCWEKRRRLHWRVLTPNSTRQRRYDDGYQLYLETFLRLVDWFHRLSQQNGQT